MRADPGAPRRHPARRGSPRPIGELLTPVRVAFGLAILVAGALLLLGLLRRDATQIPILAAGLIVLALAFLGSGIAAAVGAMRAARAGRPGRALGAALLGGLFVVAGALALASAVVLSLVWESA